MAFEILKVSNPTPSPHTCWYLTRRKKITIKCNGAVNVAWCCGFYPAKSLNGASSRILNGPGTKS
jgi:hypothetical protein